MILSIDASTKNSGYAIYEENGTLIKYGCIPASSKDLIKRILIQTTELSHILDQYSIDTIILEEVRFETGERVSATYKALMYLQAAINFLIYNRKERIDIIYMYPSEWRKICGIRTGRGIKREVLKQEDIKFVENTFKLKVNDDEADAIGIGYAYLHKEDTSQDLNWGL